MFFVWVAIFSYLLFALNAVIDKFLLHEKRIGHPATYAFGIGILSLVALGLMPFGFSIPPASTILLSILAGCLFTYALFVFFGSLKVGEASRVVPITGAFVPLFTFLAARFLLDEQLGSGGNTAFALLIVGSILMTYEDKYRDKHHRNTFALAVFAALLFALSFTLSKQIFTDLGFINGLIWTRFGMALGAITLLMDRESREAIKTQANTTKRSTGIWFIAGQLIGALAGFTQNYAISLGSVSIVNALQGVQFAFVLVLTSFITVWRPKILNEKLTRGILLQKIIAIFLISVGIIILIT